MTATDLRVLSPDPPYERLLSEQEAVEALGLSDRPNPGGSLRWLIRTKRLGCVRLGRILRFKLSDIREFVDRNHCPAEERN